MTYQLEPELALPYNRHDREAGGKCCIGPAKRLLDCLEVPSMEVMCVSVKSIRLDIDFDRDDCDC